MKKFLKTITVLIILCMLVLTLSGCGKKKEEKNIESENKLNAIEAPSQQHIQENISTTEETSNDEQADKEMKKSIYEYYNLFKDYAAASDNQEIKSEVRTLLSLMITRPALAVEITNELLKASSIPSFGIHAVEE